MGENRDNKLSRKDLFSMAIGQIIGVGIMTMTGIAIGFTGRSVSLAYIVAGVITVVSAIPQIYIGGTANFIGGQYSQIAVLGNKRLAGVYIYIQIAMSVGISMFTLSFCDYFLSLFAGANVKIVSFILLTLLFGLHLLGIKQAARLQNLLCIVLAVAIAAYIAFGIGHIQPGYFDAPGFLSGGPLGFIMASVYLTFAAGGATFVVNYSAESKNPTKDIPFVIIVSTIAVVAVYAVMATIASGSVPVEQAANMPLSVSAVTFMPSAVFTFFVVGGAMFALLTTLNFNIGMIVYPVLKACDDGWLPKSLAVKNKKFDTAHRILLALYIIALVPILLGININEVANSTVILTSAIRCVICFVALYLPARLTDLWEKSAFHVSNIKLRILSVVGMFLSGVSVVLLLVTTKPAQIICNVCILGAAVVLACFRNNHVVLKAGYTEK